MKENRVLMLEFMPLFCKINPFSENRIFWIPTRRKSQWNVAICSKNGILGIPGRCRSLGNVAVSF